MHLCCGVNVKLSFGGADQEGLGMRGTGLVVQGDMKGRSLLWGWEINLTLHLNRFT